MWTESPDLATALIIVLMGERDYPLRSVRLIDPFGAGGGPDLVARALAPFLSELWGAPVTVENHPGIGSTAGPALVAQSPADGHTLLVSTSAHAYSALFKSSLPYDPFGDFTPIAPISTQPYVLVAGLRAGVSTLAELVSAAKVPVGMTFGSSGLGTATHVGVVKLNDALHIEARHVPASGTDAISDTIAHVVAGMTDYALSPISIAQPHIRGERLVALGVSTTRRSRLLPDVPTLAEGGAQDFDFPIWYGLWAPAGTPAEAVSELSTSVGFVLAQPALRDWLAEHDADPMTMAQREFHRFVLSESEAAAAMLGTALSRSSDAPSAVVP
jgi:tripartite-type tricarboxylate transporter receptor subunit TctC